MQLDIIIPTHNRRLLLRRLLDSLRDADRPNDLNARVTVVDNCSSDDTRSMVLSYGNVWEEPPGYVLEPVLGKAVALNRGIRTTSGDLVGFLDDDERVDRAWLRTARDVFQDPDVDFISGPYLPDWGAVPPMWLPRSYPAVIGWIDAGDRIVRYDKAFAGMMMGGNAIVRRACVDRVGLFTGGIGRIGHNPGTGEDADYFERLMGAGARGYYVPQLAIYHFIPPERLTKRYHRKWCFLRGASLGQRDHLRPQPVKYCIGVPRYLVGEAARAVPGIIRAALRRRDDPEQTFTHELRLWDVAGFVFGKLSIIGRRRTLSQALSPGLTKSAG